MFLIESKCGKKYFMNNTSLIIYGYNEEDSHEVYDLVEKKLLRENPSLNKNLIQDDISAYFERYGMNYFCYNLDWGEICIGCNLPGIETQKNFIESIKEKEKLFKKFDEDHGTKFSRNAIIYSAISESDSEGFII